MENCSVEKIDFHQPKVDSTASWTRWENHRESERIRFEKYRNDIERNEKDWEKMLPNEGKNYWGGYIAFFDGKIIGASDDDYDIYLYTVSHPTAHIAYVPMTYCNYTGAK